MNKCHYLTQHYISCSTTTHMKPKLLNDTYTIGPGKSKAVLAQKQTLPPRIRKQERGVASPRGAEQQDWPRPARMPSPRRRHVSAQTIDTLHAQGQPLQEYSKPITIIFMIHSHLKKKKKKKEKDAHNLTILLQEATPPVCAQIYTLFYP